MAQDEITIRVVVYKTGSTWVAQAIEIDIAQQGKTINATMARLIAAIADKYNYTCEKYGEPFKGLREAPDHFRQMFDDATQDDGEDIDFDITPRLNRSDVRTPPHIAARFVEDQAA